MVIIISRGAWLVLASIPGRIKIRFGTYCMGDSAHALQITQNMGNRTRNVKPYCKLVRLLRI